MEILMCEVTESRWRSLEFCGKMANVCAGNVSLFRHMDGEEW
jgi:hypothetical protein